MSSLLDPAVLAMMIPILFALIPIIAIFGGLYVKFRRERMVHETIRMLADKGQPIPPELLDRGGLGGPLSGGTMAAGSRGSSLTNGLRLVAIGIGLGVMLYAMNPSDWFWAVGAIPLCLGLAYLLQWKLEQKPPA